MLKSRGVQEVNLDFSDIYRQIIEYPVSVTINILLFVPVGAIAYKYSRSVVKASLIALICISAIEGLQYILHLGIADVVDVVVDMIGFLIGYLALNVLNEIGFRVVAKDDRHVKVALSQSGETGNSNTNSSRRSRVKVVAIAVFFVAAFGVFMLGFRYYDYQEYVPLEAPAILNTDETLTSLSLSPKTSEELESIVENMRLFEINGVASSRDWIEVTGEGELISEGRVSNYQAWNVEDGSRYYGLSLGVLENLEGVTVTHGVPLIVTPQTKVVLSDDEIDRDTFIKDILPNYYRYKLVAEYTLQNGWFRAEVLRFEPHEDDINYYVWFDYENYTEATSKIAEDSSDYWFSIFSGVRTPIEGYVDILHEDGDAGNSFTLRIADKLGDAMICHSVNIAFRDDIPPSYAEKLPTDSGNMMSFTALFEKGRVLYDG